MNAFLAEEFSDSTAAKVLQAARGACQGKERPVERLVHLERKVRKSEAVSGTDILPGRTTVHAICVSRVSPETWPPLRGVTCFSKVKLALYQRDMVRG